MSNVFPKVVIMLDNMTQHFDFHIVVYNIPIFFKLRKKHCVENIKIQIYKFHYVLFEHNDFDIHEVLFIISF
jgi:hypothetical protein